MAGEYRFSFGPWNIHEGSDPFGPMVRSAVTFAKKLKLYKTLGFDGVQFHDDDAVPELGANPRGFEGRSHGGDSGFGTFPASFPLPTSPRRSMHRAN